MFSINYNPHYHQIKYRIECIKINEIIKIVEQQNNKYIIDLLQQKKKNAQEEFLNCKKEQVKNNQRITLYYGNYSILRRCRNHLLDLKNYNKKNTRTRTNEE